MSRRSQFACLRDETPLVLPSLLMCDFGNLAAEIGRLETAGVRALHLDVMDGHFVPNLSYGAPIVAAVRDATDLPLDVHLMISNPLRYLESYHEAGASSMTVHVEADDDPVETLRRIRDLGVAAGIAINPETPLNRLEPCLEWCDLVLVMSVHPGFGGQAFEPVALDKLRQLAVRVGDQMLLQVDGGVNRTTIADCAQAGAHLFVAGSAIFAQDDYGQSVAELTQLACITTGSENHGS